MVLKLESEDWGKVDGNQTKLYTIKDEDSGFLVHITDYGATLVRVKVPDKKGNSDDVVFGQDNPADFKKHGAYLGAMVGRVANRIEDGKFTLEGETYTLAKNNAGKHCLHGGEEGFTYKMWEVLNKKCDGENAKLELKYVCEDGEEGFPGSLDVHIIYFISKDPMELGWEITATTDETTIINMTNHAYWNLKDLDSTIDDHILKVASNKYMPGDKNNLVTGEIKSVENTGLDFRKPIKIEKAFNEFGDIDNNFFLSNYDAQNPKDLIFAAKLYSPESGRKMNVKTTEPCIQLYSGNYMEGVSSFGKERKKHCALCLETQRVPNAINIPEFRQSVILRPGQNYYHKTVHTFELD